jgi:hypothetical protein
MMAFVYCITAPNGQQYIGVSIDPEGRFKEHARSNWLIGRAIRKHGAMNMTLKRLLEGPESYCYEMEALLIERFQTIEPGGYNMASGGKHVGFTAEIKQRMSEAAKRRWADPERRQEVLKHITSPQTKAKQRQSCKDGWLNGRYQTKVK